MNLPRVFTFMLLLLPVVATSLDKPTQQVIIEPRIVETSRSTAKLIGVVFPADMREGDRVSGKAVTNPQDYQGIPGLTVVSIPSTTPKTAAGSASLTGVVVDTENQDPKTADRPIIVDLPLFASALRLRLEPIADADACIRMKISLGQLTSIPNEQFSAPPVIIPGTVQIIRGPFGGDCNQTSIDIGGLRTDVIVESPREAYISVPPNLPAGRNDITVTDGSHCATLPTYVLNLDMWADQLLLQKGQSTKFHVVVSGLEQLTADQWKAGMPTELVDLLQLQQRAPGFEPPRTGEQGRVLLVLENVLPNVVSMKDSKDERIIFNLERKDFANGPFRYDGTIKSKQTGTFNINGIVAAFLAPVTAQERDVLSSNSESVTPQSSDDNRHKQLGERLHQLSDKTKEACTKISDPEEKLDLEQFAKYLDERADEVAGGSDAIPEELADFVFTCQSNDDVQMLKKVSDAYKKYLDTTDYSIKQKANDLHKEIKTLQKKAEDANIKGMQAGYQKYDPEKKKQAEDAYKKWQEERDKRLDAAQKAADAKQNVKDAREKADAAAKNSGSATGKEFSDYEQAKKDLAAAEAESKKAEAAYDAAKQAWDKAIEANQKAINPDLQKQADDANKEEKSLKDQIQKKIGEYNDLIDEYEKSGNQNLYKEYEKLKDQYLNPPKVQT